MPNPHACQQRTTEGRALRIDRLWVIATLLVAACQSAPASGGAASEPAAPVPSATPADGGRELREPNTFEGIFTPGQAQRGRQVYDDVCSRCHQPEEWQDNLFLARWDGESVYRFWYFIYERMPDGEPPYSLPREQVTDVLTYILELNGVPAGDTELGSDDESIDQHWLYWGETGSTP